MLPGPTATTISRPRRPVPSGPNGPSRSVDIAPTGPGMAWNPTSSDDVATRGPSAGELRRWTGEIVAVLTVLAIIVALGTGAAHSEDPTRPRARGPVATVHRGLSSLDAAPSCWAIKQAFPSSRSGTYWLQTVQLVTPGRYYCDMTTGGGG